MGKQKLFIHYAVQNAIDIAVKMADKGTDKKEVNRNRSINFVEALADQFRIEYQEENYLYTLTKHSNRKHHKQKFGMYELLFDILVCHTKTITNQNKEFTIVTDSIWAVESELAKNTREAIFDFNKLVLGSSKYKLFIGPKNKKEGYLNSLSDLAKICGSNTFIALVPHPEEWNKNGENKVDFWEKHQDWEKQLLP